MKVRGQSSEAWRARFRQGTCPVHGRGLVERSGSDDDGGQLEIYCTKEECDFAASQWSGKDRYHSRLGWVSGPEKVKAALVTSSDIREDSNEPGFEARMIRTSWPLGEGEE
ncbi:MAG: hypothetical protein GY822_04815 [Deltaproteobacteria bacterium]|nr:hypothetical protein [Deltaproteobacteria bacterium]